MTERLNQHLKEIGSDKKILFVSSEVALTDEQIATRLCTKCNKPATHIASFNFTEKLLCDEHADICRRKNQYLPADLWFCKLLK